MTNLVRDCISVDESIHDKTHQSDDSSMVFGCVSYDLIVAYCQLPGIIKGAHVLQKG